MRNETADSKALSASEPQDADPTELEAEGVGLDKEPGEQFPVWLPEGLDENALLQFAKKNKSKHKQWFGDSNGYSERILNWWKAYEGKLLAGQTSPASIPLSNSIVETDMAKVYQAAFSRAKVLDAQPRAPQVDNENKQTVEDLINQEVLFGYSRIAEKALDAFKGLGIEGTGVGRLEWETRWLETIPDPMVLDQSSGQMVMTKTIAQIKKFKKIHGPNCEFEPIQCMGWDHRVGTRLQDSEWVFHQQFPTLTDLLIMQENGQITNVDVIQTLAEGQKLAQANPDEKRKKLLGPGGQGPSEGDYEEPAKRLDEWFAQVPYQQPQADGTKKWTKCQLHFMVVNEEVLVMCEQNPWLDESGHGLGHPFFSFRKNIQPRELLGTAVHAPVMEMQTRVNNLQDSLQKLITKAAKSPTFVSRAAGLDTLRLFQDEMAIIPVVDPDKIKSHPVDGTTIKAVSEERSFSINMTRETVAANEQAQGVTTPSLGSATATYNQIINANSGTRFQLFVDQLGFEFFAAIGNGFWWMIRQWAEEGDLVVRESTIDGEPRPITRAHLVDDYYFVPITSAVVNDKNAQLQNKMNFAEKFGQLQATNPAAMMDAEGNRYNFDLIDFAIKELMPLMNIRNGRTYMSKIAPGMPGPAGLPPTPAQTPPPGPPGSPPPGAMPQQGLPGRPGMPPPQPTVPVAPQPGFVPGGNPGA